MKVLVTGATGFVGACLTRRLVQLGCEVHVFTRNVSNKWRIADLSEKITEHNVDLQYEESVQQALKSIKPSVICHLATYGGFAFQRDTSTIMTSNLLGTVNLLRACEKVGFECFINTGSSSEYGLKSRAMRENDILEPLGDYGVSKAAATLFCQSEAITRGLPIVTLRLFSPYGPWDDPQRFIPYVMRSFLSGESPQLSNPTSVRDYIYIDDVVDFYLKVLENPQAAGDIYNLGTGRQHTIGEVVGMLQDILSPSSTPVWGVMDKQRPEPAVWVAEMEKVRKDFGWMPPTSLDTGLQKTLMWFQENLAYYA